MAANDDEGLLKFWKQTHLWTTPRVKGGSVLAEFRPFFTAQVPHFFFFFL